MISSKKEKIMKLKEELVDYKAKATLEKSESAHEL